MSNTGKHVLADFGDEVDGVHGEILAHYLGEGDGGKHKIQRPDGKVEQLTLSDHHQGGGYFRWVNPPAAAGRH